MPTMTKPATGSTTYPVVPNPVLAPVLGMESLPDLFSGLREALEDAADEGRRAVRVDHIRAALTYVAELERRLLVQGGA